jgi:hypothetical protein
MNLRLAYSFAILLFTAALNVNAKTVVWIVVPTYESAKPYAQNLYLCQLNGKWGVVDADGRSVIPIQYDFVTSPNRGIGLFGIREGNKYRLHGFIRSDGMVIPLSEKYYAIPEYLSFSEGKLCVANSSGKQGFIGENGNLVVKCQFDVVRPFKEGLSSVKKGSWVYYIRENYDNNPDQNVVYSEWNNGEITRGSSFKNGEAVIGYGTKYKVINQYGRELRDFNASKWKIDPSDYTIVDENSNIKDNSEIFKPQYSQIEVITENGKCGFRLNDEIILPPALGSASLVDLNSISIVSYKGKIGLLKIIDESVNSLLQSNGHAVRQIYVDLKGYTDTLQYTISLPKQLIGHTELFVDKGDGVFESASSAVTSGTRELKYSFHPKIADEDNSAILRCRLLYDGMEVFNSAQTLSIERPIKLRLSEVSTTTAQADIKTEIQQVSATVFNDSNRDVTVTATLSIDCKSNDAVSQTFSIAIPAGSSKSISLPVKVRADEDAAATIQLNTGEQNKSTVALRIY